MASKFEWHRDEQGEFIPFVSNEGEFDMRPDDQTVIFMYVGQYACMSHLWYERPDLGETEDTVMGMRIWQAWLDEKYGEGTFSNLCEEMIDRGFPFAQEEEPSELDKQAYYKCFPNAQEEEIEQVVEQLMTNFDAGLEYYRVEWGEQYGRG